MKIELWLMMAIFVIQKIFKTSTIAALMHMEILRMWKTEAVFYVGTQICSVREQMCVFLYLNKPSILKSW